MSDKKFNIAFSTIATSPFPQFLKLVMKFPVDVRYYKRCLVAGIISLLSEPFRFIENFFYSRKLAQTPLPQSPVFILGHWRSGTTLLHNVLCKDKQFAFVTTYQSVFVNQFFASRWLFKRLMKLLMPEKRPADNVLLSPDFPQEEGFALCNLNSYAFYNFWYFPRQWKLFYDKYVACKNVEEPKIQRMNKRYKKLIAQSLIEHNCKEFIAKNPANTGSVKQLLQMFPQAKFIYIYRNPIMVFQSSLKFFNTTLESLKLQNFSAKEVEELIFSLYKQIITDYEKQKSLIPKENLVEIRYEDFLKDPLVNLKKIYRALGLKNFENALPDFAAYLEQQKHFEKNTHQFSEEQMDAILNRLNFAMQLYSYSSPQIIDPRLKQAV